MWLCVFLTIIISGFLARICAETLNLDPENKQSIIDTGIVPFIVIALTACTRTFISFLTDKDVTIYSKTLRVRPELFTLKYYFSLPVCTKLIRLCTYLICYIDASFIIDAAYLFYLVGGLIITWLAMRFPRPVIYVFIAVWLILIIMSVILIWPTF